MKQPTSWSNTPKNTGAWTPQTKTATTWGARDTRTATVFTPASKNTTGWGPIHHTDQTYYYDDANIPYDSALFEYNYYVNNNTFNNLYQTPWSAV
jgi:hypothetical protein